MNISYSDKLKPCLNVLQPIKKHLKNDILESETLWFFHLYEDVETDEIEHRPSFSGIFHKQNTANPTLPRCINPDD